MNQKRLLSLAARSCSVLLLCAASSVALSLPKFHVLHSFDGTHGGYASAGLVPGAEGDLFGTTSVGGSNIQQCDPFGCGTVFKMTPEGTLAVLHYFGGTDGYGPEASLIQGTDEAFYG